MSTPDDGMAPAEPTATAPTPGAAPVLAPGVATPADAGAPRSARGSSASRKGEVGGVLIPGGVLGALIALCWLVHQFGLPAVVFALLAVAASATAAVVIKTSRRTARAASGRGRAVRSTGGAGPGRAMSPGRGPGRSGGLPAPRRGGGSGKAGGAARKPTGMGSVKGMSSRAGSAPANSASRTLGKTVGAARALTGPKPHKGSLFGGATRPAGVNGGRGAAPGSAPGASSRGGKSRTPAGAAGSRRAWGGLLGRRNGRSGIAPGGKGAGKRNQGKGGPQGGAGAAKNTGKGTAAGTSGATKAKKKGASGGKATAPGARGTRFSLFRKRRKQGATASPGTGPATGAKPKKGRGAGKKGKVGSAKAPRHRRYTWKQPHLKLAAAAGQFYTRHTSPAFRRRLRTAGKPVRAVYRRVRRHGGKGLANVLRFGGRTVLRVHTALKGVRFSTLGPNWLRPLSRVLSWATSPAAALVTLSRKWGWLNAWIYKTATSRPASAAAGPGGTPAANAPAAGGHQPVPSPASPISPKGSTPVDNSPVQHAYPLMRAAESIRLAGVAFASAPADSMKGYEAVIEHLGSLNLAMFELLQCIATVTEDEFKVNAAVPGAFREISLHFLLLGEFIDGAHVVYRQVHAEQLDNIENPTWQGRKWDISANWGSVIPMHSWAAPQVHAMPLLFAAAAIREAGASIQLHPSGSMVGYEMTIEHLAPLAEELGLLMATVAAVTESEFRVSAAVSEMHRDAGTRFRDLGGWIQAVHVAYRQIHEEQIRNLEEPSYQAAKWDQSRNT